VRRQPCTVSGVMYWLAIPAVAYFFRGKIAQVLAPILPEMAPLRAAFFMHCLLIISAVVYVVPLELVGAGFVKRPAYLLSMWCTTLSSVFALKGNYGSPPMPQNFSMDPRKFKESFQKFAPVLQPWMQKAMMSVDFHFLFFSLIFLTAYPSVWVLLILGRRSLWNVCTVCTKDYPESRLWKMFEGTWKKLQARNSEVLEYSALGEVLLGIWLAVAILLPMRQFFTCILYWNYLRMRYQVPRSQEQHKKAWLLIAGKTDFFFKVPVVGPLACKARDYAVGWFTRTQ